jgi:hypothetical protein
VSRNLACADSADCRFWSCGTVQLHFCFQIVLESDQALGVAVRCAGRARGPILTVRYFQLSLCSQQPILSSSRNAVPACSALCGVLCSHDAEVDAFPSAACSNSRFCCTFACCHCGAISSISLRPPPHRSCIFLSSVSSTPAFLLLVPHLPLTG